MGSTAQQRICRQAQGNIHDVASIDTIDFIQKSQVPPGKRSLKPPLSVSAALSNPNLGESAT